MNINFTDRIRDYCLENSIDYTEEKSITDDLFVNYHAVLGGGKIEIYRMNNREYSFYIAKKRITEVFTASQFREAYALIKGEIQK